MLSAAIVDFLSLDHVTAVIDALLDHALVDSEARIAIALCCAS